MERKEKDRKAGKMMTDDGARGRVNEKGCCLNRDAGETRRREAREKKRASLSHSLIQTQHHTV